MGKAKGEPLVFEGFTVPAIEFELTGGGTHETGLVVALGDVVEGRFRAKVVNVKHPFKSGQVQRVQTVNVESADIDSIVEKYVAPPPPATDVPIPGVDE